MGRRDREIGKKIRVAREAVGLSQRDVAEILQMSHVGFGDIERGKNQPSIDYLFDLAEILGRPVTWFLGIDTDLADDEAELVHLYRQIDDERMRAMVMNTARDAVRILRGK